MQVALAVPGDVKTFISSKAIPKSASVIAGPWISKAFWAHTSEKTFSPLGLVLLCMVVDRNARTTVCRAFNFEKIVEAMGKSYSPKEMNGAKMNQLIDSVTNDSKQYIACEFQLYCDIRPIPITSTFLSIEVDDGIIGLSFPSSTEAEKVLNNIFANAPTVANIEEELGTTLSNAKNMKPSDISGPITGAALLHSHGSVAKSSPPVVNDKLDQKKKKKGLGAIFSRFGKKKPSESEISSKDNPNSEIIIGDIIPGTFKHEGHIGAGQETKELDVNNLPKEWKVKLKELGVSKKQLKKDPVLAQTLITIMQGGTGVDQSVHSALSTAVPIRKPDEIVKEKMSAQAAIPKPSAASSSSTITSNPPPIPSRKRASLKPQNSAASSSTVSIPKSVSKGSSPKSMGPFLSSFSSVSTSAKAPPSSSTTSGPESAMITGGVQMIKRGGHEDDLVFGVGAPVETLGRTGGLDAYSVRSDTSRPSQPSWSSAVTTPAHSPTIESYQLRPSMSSDRSPAAEVHPDQSSGDIPQSVIIREESEDEDSDEVAFEKTSEESRPLTSAASFFPATRSTSTKDSYSSAVSKVSTLPKEVETAEKVSKPLGVDTNIPSTSGISQQKRGHVKKAPPVPPITASSTAVASASASAASASGTSSTVDSAEIAPMTPIHRIPSPPAASSSSSSSAWPGRLADLLESNHPSAGNVSRNVPSNLIDETSDQEVPSLATQVGKEGMAGASYDESEGQVLEDERENIPVVSSDDKLSTSKKVDKSSSSAAISPAPRSLLDSIKSFDRKSLSQSSISTESPATGGSIREEKSGGDDMMTKLRMAVAARRGTVTSMKAVDEEDEDSDWSVD